MKELNVSFSYKYVNVSGEKHFQEVVFDGGDTDVPALKEYEKKLREAFSGKNGSAFIASQLDLPELFDFVANYEKDSCWHIFAELDFTAKDISDPRSIQDLVVLAGETAEKGWEKFDVLEKITGRIPRKLYLKEIEQINKAYTREIEALNREHSREIDLVNKSGLKELEHLKKNYMKEIDLITGAHEKEAELTSKTHAKELDSMNRTYEKEIDSIKKNLQKDMELMGRKQEMMVAQLRETSEVIDLYLNGDASSDDVEKLLANIKKMVVSL